jgi:hypothetical protein
MIIIESFVVAILLLFVTMLCWGSSIGVSRLGAQDSVPYRNEIGFGEH